MSFVETDRTALDAELARQTLLRLKFEDETRRQAEVQRRIEEEAARAADKVIVQHLYESTPEEIDLNKQLIRLKECDMNWRTCANPTVKIAKERLHNLQALQNSYNHRRFTSQADKDALQRQIDTEIQKVDRERNKITSALKEIQENKREEIRLQFITTAKERERAKRLEETNAATEAIRLAEAAQEAERLRIIQEEAQQRELEFAEHIARMAAVEAEHKEALRLAEVNRQIGLQSEKTFKVEAPEPVMTSMSTISLAPMLIIGGAAALLLLGRRK